MITTIQKQRAGYSAVERAAQEEDRVNIDFEGTVDGEAFQGNSGKGVPVVIGSNRMIEGFEAGIVGKKAGEELTLDLQFPEDYAHKAVAGKPVQFNIKVNSVEEVSLPQIDDEFVKTLGIEDGTVEKLREEISANMEKEVVQKVKASMKESVMDKLIELNQIDIPKALIDNEATALLDQMKQQMHSPAGKGIDLDKSMFEPQAKRRVALGLIISELVKQNDIKASADKVREQIEIIASSYDTPEEVISWYYGDKKRLAEIESIVLEQAVVDWIASQVEVKEVSSNFSELMGQS
jgi:trigger factor